MEILAFSRHLFASQYVLWGISGGPLHEVPLPGRGGTLGARRAAGQESVFDEVTAEARLAS